MEKMLGKLDYEDYMSEIREIVESIRKTPKNNSMPQSSGKRVYYSADFDDYESWSAIK